MARDLRREWLILRCSKAALSKGERAVCVTRPGEIGGGL
jgi:hypothetical protein